MGKKLNEDEIGEALDLLGNNYPNFIMDILHLKRHIYSSRDY